MGLCIWMLFSGDWIFDFTGYFSWDTESEIHVSINSQ